MHEYKKKLPKCLICLEISASKCMRDAKGKRFLETNIFNTYWKNFKRHAKKFEAQIESIQHNTAIPKKALVGQSTIMNCAHIFGYLVDEDKVGFEKS